MEQKPEIAPPSQHPFDTIEGTLERFTFRNAESGFAVVRFVPTDGTGRIAAVGQLAQLAEGQQLRITGRHIDHPRFGPQIEVQSVEAVLPGSVPGIRAYLSSSLVKGIGPKTAERITDRFGVDTLKIIAQQPERLHEVPGLGEKRIADLVAAVQSQKDVQEVMVFLRTYGLGQALATRIVKHYGKGASALIQANPFRLADDVIGIGFRTADRLAAELGIAADAEERIQAGTIYSLAQAARNGHCFVPRPEIVDATAELLALDPAAVEAQLEDLSVQGRIRIEQPLDPAASADSEIPRVYPSTLHAAEDGVAQTLAELHRHKLHPLKIDPSRALAWFEQFGGLHLPAAQHVAVRNALTEPVSVITGGPGVGKTTIIRAIAKILQRDECHLLLCAPTGRAAKRLGESTGHPASTIHRLLDWQPGLNRFGRDPENPLKGHVIVVDEASMLDVQLAYNLLRAIPPSMKVILVGDVDQLPSVGPGQVLHDIIESQTIPVTRLTEIFRQKGESLIVENAHGLLQGEVPRTGGEDSDFYVIESRDSRHTRELVEELVARRIPRRFDLDPVRDVQVLCPMYRGHAGADTLNKDLQQLLNPGSQPLERGGRSFHRGDKVMQIRNDYDLDLFNGDTGRIVSIEPKDSVMEVQFAKGMVLYPFSELDALVPAYAITVHRAQGSEYPAVVIPLATDHYMMLRRNLLYTAITRGRQLVVLVGSQKALGMAVRNNEEANRYSGLAERIRDLSRTAGGGR